MTLYTIHITYKYNDINEFAGKNILYIFATLHGWKWKQWRI